MSYYADSCLYLSSLLLLMVYIAVHGLLLKGLLDSHANLRVITAALRVIRLECQCRLVLIVRQNVLKRSSS